MSHLEVLEGELRRFQLDLPRKQALTLAQYCDELSRWNLKINLTGLQGIELVRRLVVEPVWVARQLDPAGTLVDIGSGNGSPAIPLHVVGNLLATHLIEARQRRAAFLRHIVSFLELRGITVHHKPLKDMGSDVRKPDWVTLQGLALTDELLECIKTFSSTATKIVWITSAPRPPIIPYNRLQIPFSQTEALIFQIGPFLT